MNWIVFHGSSKVANLNLVPVKRFSLIKFLQSIHVHLGERATPLDLMDVDAQSRAASPRPTKTDEEISVTTSSGIKAGTDHSDSIMRTRRAYRWETLMSENQSGRSIFSKGAQAIRDHRWHFWHDENVRKQEYWISWRGRVSQWFGLSPRGRVHWYMGGVSVDVVLEHDGSEARYVKL